MRHALLLLASVLALVATPAHASLITISSPEWIEIENKLRNASRIEKIRGVNEFLNARPHELVMDKAGTYRVAPDRAANCQDFSTTKQIMLERLGIESVIYNAVVLATGERHAYVFVKQERLVLDSRRPHLLSTEQVRAEYRQLAASEPTVRWFRINDYLAKEKS